MRKFRILTEPRQKTFMGKLIYRYKVYNKEGILRYTCVSTRRTIDEVLFEIHKMYENIDGYKVVCNGDVIYTHNYKKLIDKRKIIDKNTGSIYINIYDFMDQFELNKGQAITKIKKLNRFEYIS